jgi:hypothetical protein
MLFNSPCRNKPFMNARFIKLAQVMKRTSLMNLVLFMSLLFILMLKPVQAQQVASKHWKENFQQMHLLGQGDFRWFGFHIYSAKLWSEQTKFMPAQSFALELTYKKSISKSRFTDSSIDEIKRIYKDQYSTATLQQWRSYMDLAFIDVKSEDQLIGVFLPNMGLRFYSKDKLLAEIKDVEFAQAFFAIWLHPKTRDEELRQKLMGG